MNLGTPFEWQIGWRYVRAGRSGSPQRLHLVHLADLHGWASRSAWPR
jgi:hypothetical protein